MSWWRVGRIVWNFTIQVFLWCLVESYNARLILRSLLLLVSSCELLKVERGLLHDFLLEHLDVVFEALEGYKDYGEVVQTAIPCWGVQNLISNQPWDCVDWRDLPRTVRLLADFSSHIPDNLIDLIVFELVKDAIRSYQSVVKVVDTAHLMSGLRIAGYDTLHSPEMNKLSLAITKSSAYG